MKGDEMVVSEYVSDRNPDLDVSVKDLLPDQVIPQLFFLFSGLADERDARKGVSLGLPIKLLARRDELLERINDALEHQYAYEQVTA
ncbi:hypothetical protein K9M47_01210 [Candidatus Gracilibacteria bacterium]|nr:hypothetical protein [Candidatus Gracilibacteria bacterium]